MVGYLTRVQLPSSYTFFNKFGGLSDWEINEILTAMIAKNLDVKAGASLIDDMKHMRLTHIISSSLSVQVRTPLPDLVPGFLPRDQLEKDGKSAPTKKERTVAREKSKV